MDTVETLPEQLDRIEAMLVELIHGKRELEQAMKEFQAKGPMGMLKGLM